MRQTKTRMELYSFYDHVGLAAHMEKQARKGWLLEDIGRWGWKYRRIEPKPLKFAVTYFPPASVFDPEPSEEEHTFRAYCEQAGWQLAASSAQLQIFYNEDPDPIPLETDAVMQVENIHAAAKKTTLLSNWLLGVMGLFYAVMWVVSFIENPVAILADYGGWFRALSFGMLVLLCAVELVTYYRWHRKAVKAAEETGRLHPTKSHRVFQAVSLIILVGGLILWFLSMQTKRTKVLLAVSMLNMTILILAVQGCQQLCKKLKISKTKNKIITLTVDILLAFLLMGLLPQVVMEADLSDRTPVDTYVYLGRTREIYDDPLPVEVEDLMDVDSAGYFKELEIQRTPIAAIYDAYQSYRRDRTERLPGMEYRLAISAIPAWTEFFWHGWIEDYQPEKSSYRYLEAQNPEPWGAVEAFRICYKDSDPGGWLVCWEDRFVRLNADWELTEEQMGRIADSILQCAE